MTIGGASQGEKVHIQNDKLEEFEDFSKIPFDNKFFESNPFGDMKAVGYGLDSPNGIVLPSEDSSDDDIDENPEENLEENNENHEQLEEIQEPLRRSERITTPTTRMLHSLEQQLDSEEKD